MKKRVIAILALMLVFSSVLFSQSDKEKSEDRTRVAREVFATVAMWADAVRSRDIKTLDKIFEDHMVITTYDGQTRGKAEELEILKPDLNIKTIAVNNEDMKVRVFGKAAVVTALTKMHFVIDKKDVNAAFRYTAVFVKEDGRWQIVALQTARFAPPKTN